MNMLPSPQIEGLVEDFDAGLRLLARIIDNPSALERAIAKVRAQILDVHDPIDCGHPRPGPQRVCYPFHDTVVKVPQSILTGAGSVRDHVTAQLYEVLSYQLAAYDKIPVAKCRVVFSYHGIPLVIMEHLDTTRRCSDPWIASVDCEQEEYSFSEGRCVVYDAGIAPSAMHLSAWEDQFASRLAVLGGSSQLALDI